MRSTLKCVHSEENAVNVKVPFNAVTVATLTLQIPDIHVPGIHFIA